MESLADRVALVTGAAQGIGLGIARSLARAGCSVVLSDIAQGELDSATTEIADLGAPCRSVIADVTRADDVDRLVRESVDTFSRLDILVNNAGVVILKPIQETSEAEWDRVLDTNLKGTFLCSKRAIPEIASTGGGSIINISSIAAFAFTTPHIPYAASKAGIWSLTRDLAYEVAPQRIRVNAIAPGPIETAMFDSLTDAERAAHAKTVPLGRLGQTRDIGDAVVFLASDAASFITGATLPVTGGTDLRIT